METSVISTVTGINFKEEYETDIDKKSIKKIWKWLETQIFKAKNCIKKICRVCEVYFEPLQRENGCERFYISISQSDGGLMFTLKKRVCVDKMVNERFSKISKSQFSDFIKGNFAFDSQSDDLIFEFCQKAKVEQLKASYACHFEREEYIFKRSGAFLTIDKEFEITALNESKKLPHRTGEYRLRLKNLGTDEEFFNMKNKLITVCQ